MHFLGPIRGVLPLGPNGVTALNTLESSPFDTNAAAMISYNYTLNQQGFSSNITCIYDDHSPIRFTPVPGNPRMVAYNASCADLGLAAVLPPDVVDYPTLNVNNTLTFWACKSIPIDGKEPTYHVYLRGRLGYESIANVTCLVSSIQAAIFPVEYQSVPSFFFLQGPKRDICECESCADRIRCGSARGCYTGKPKYPIQFGNRIGHHLRSKKFSVAAL